MALVEPFTRAEAKRAGITDAMLRHKRFRRLFRGLYILTSVELTLTTWCLAALRVSPSDAVMSHLTALRLYGLELGDPWPLHVSTRALTHTRQQGIRMHQRKHQMDGTVVHGVPATSPERTLVDIATKVSLIQLVQACDWMIHRGQTTAERLAAYAVSSHLDGVCRLRRVIGCVRGGDLVYTEYMVLVEYDGWHHERDAWQRQRDITRREDLEAAGWRVIVVTVADLTDKRAVVRRIHRALLDHGYAGRPPQFSMMWDRWFA